ncbi:MAG: glutamate formimidoyltransferase [Thermoanaerobaculales bacterium]|nr:glutamate formimidoyltransferase [Thermoanaerobaculales bacterium]
MTKIIACVPNISEGKDQRFIDDLEARLRAIDGLMILDVAVDHDQNRTVLSFTGSKEAIFEGGFLLYDLSLKQIDMRQHQGDYPRVGAVDVFPFVPLKGADINDAKEWAEEFAEQVAERFSLPVYLFAASARYRYRRDVQNIRHGEYEAFAEKMKDLRWKPDLGPDCFPEDKGVTIIGARHPLISFKVSLGTRNLEIAEAVGHCVADASGGHIRAVAAQDHGDGHVYLSMSIVNYKTTPLYRVIENVRLEARRFGVEIRRTEITGLIPERILIEAAEYYLGMHGFNHDTLLERNIQKHLDEKFLFGG